MLHSLHMRAHSGTHFKLFLKGGVIDKFFSDQQVTSKLSVILSDISQWLFQITEQKLPCIRLQGSVSQK